MSGDTVITILQRLLDATESKLPVGAAQAVLQIRFSDEDQARIAALAANSNEGALTPDEAKEYESYIAADLLSLWKSKARLSLKQQPSAV